VNRNAVLPIIGCGRSAASGSGPFGSSGCRRPQPVYQVTTATLSFTQRGLRAPAQTASPVTLPLLGTTNAAQAAAGPLMRPRQGLPQRPCRGPLLGPPSGTALCTSPPISRPTYRTLAAITPKSPPRRPRLALRVYRTIFCTGHSAQAPRELGRLKERTGRVQVRSAVSAGAGAAAKRRRQQAVAPAWKAGAFQGVIESRPPPLGGVPSSEEAI